MTEQDFKIRSSKNSKNESRKLIASNVISKSGNIIFDFYNSVYITKITNTLSFIAFYQSSEILFSAFFSFIGGVIADKWSRQRIIFISYISSGIFCVLLFLINTNDNYLYLMFITNILLSIASSISTPSLKSFPKNITNHESEIRNILSNLKISSELIKVIAPLLSMFISVFISIDIAILLNGITFFISAILIKKINTTNYHNLIVNNDQKKEKNVNTLKYLSENKEIGFIIILSFLVNFFLAGYNLIVPYFDHFFENNSGISYFAIMLTAQALSGILMSYFYKKTNITLRLTDCIFFMGVLYLLAYFMRNKIWIFLILLTISNSFLILYNIMLQEKIYHFADDDILGRVFGLVSAISIISLPLGNLFYSILFNKITMDILLFIAIGLLLTTIVSSIYLYIYLK